MIALNKGEIALADICLSFVGIWPPLDPRDPSDHRVSELRAIAQAEARDVPWRKIAAHLRKSGLLKYSPDQPRVPAGQPGGGEFGDGSGQSRASSASQQNQTPPTEQPSWVVQMFGDPRTLPRRAADAGATIGAVAGALIGGGVGGAGGGAAGSLVAPGVGTVAGGVAGAVEGEAAGAAAGAVIGGIIGAAIGRGLGNILQHQAEGDGGGESGSDLPKNPDDLLKRGYKETTHPDAAANGVRRFENPETGDKLEFHKGRPGESGYKAEDHYHRPNPNKMGKRDYYLDKNGNPVAKGSDESHLFP